MVAATAERTRPHEPQLMRVGRRIPKRREGILVVSRATIDHNAQRPEHVFLPEEITELKAGDKKTKSRSFFTRLRRKSEDAGITFEPTVGGNGLNMAHRLKEFGEKVTVYTWASKKYKNLLLADLDHPEWNLYQKIQDVDGDMPEALVYQVPKGEGLDRIIIGTSPDMPSDFADAIDGSHEHVILNSLPENSNPQLDWRASLRRGIAKLIDKAGGTETPYTYTPGSIQMDAVRNKDNATAVYEAIAHATNLMVNIDELKDLIEGYRKGITAETDLTKLMEQGLALGAKNIFVTMGEYGAAGATLGDTPEESIIAWVEAMKPNNYVSNLGAGDAFAAGALRGNSLVERLKRGTASASFALEYAGAHENPPNEDELQKRIENKPVEHHIFAYKPRKIKL